MVTVTAPGPIPAITSEVREMVRVGRGYLAPSTMRIPNRCYTDPEIAAAEMKTTFAAPLLVAPGLRVADPGDYLTTTLIDTPVLVTRDAHHKVHVFVNACRHRGAQVANGDGCARRFTCPYHNWVYDSEGKLVGIPGREGFDDQDMATIGLVELPSAERHGFIWSKRDRAATLDLDDHLGPLGAELDSWGMSYHVAGLLDLELASNWKCALEAFQETYHFPYVHGNSLVGQGTISNISSFDQFGRHHRLGVPIKTILDDPDAQSAPYPGNGLSEHAVASHPSEHVVAIYFIYPHTVIASSPLGGEMIQFMPGPTPQRCSVRHTVLSREPVVGEVAAFFDAYTPLIQAVIRDEDGPIIESSGTGLAAGHTDVILGRNEVACQFAHRQVLADIAAEGFVV
jgi:choline monooxygenase